MPVPRFKPAHTGLLVVDVQEKLVQAMSQPAPLIASIARLIDGANLMGLPVLVTEQYRKGLGDTVAPIAQRIGSAICREEKLKFSACIEPVRAAMMERQIHRLIVCGIEAHVCVLQTCLDLLDAGCVTAVAVDAIDSRRPADREAALLRMAQAGVVPVTVESVLLELVHEAGTELFKRMLPLIK